MTLFQSNFDSLTLFWQYPPSPSKLSKYLLLFPCFGNFGCRPEIRTPEILGKLTTKPCLPISNDSRRSHSLGTLIRLTRTYLPQYFAIITRPKRFRRDSMWPSISHQSSLVCARAGTKLGANELRNKPRCGEQPLNGCWRAHEYANTFPALHWCFFGQLAMSAN